jgi:hypothetical protein
MISEPMVRLAQTVHLSCAKISTVSKWTETSLYLTLVTLEYHRERPKRLLSPWYVLRKSCTYLALTLTPPPNGLKQDLTWPTSPGVPSGASKNDFWAYDMFSTTMRLSCIKISTISKRTKTSFQLSLVTLEYHRVRQKWILTQWYIWRKPCTYLGPTLTPSLNGLKWASTWASSPRSSIGFVQNDSWAYGTFDANHAPI